MVMKPFVGEEAEIAESNDALLAQIDGFLSSIASRCSSCFVRRCQDCYSPAARALLEQMRRNGLTNTNRRTDSAISVVDEFIESMRGKGKVRGDKIYIQGISGARKVRFLSSLVERGVLDCERVVSGASRRCSLYYWLTDENKTKKEIKKQ